MKREIPSNQFNTDVCKGKTREIEQSLQKYSTFINTSLSVIENFQTTTTGKDVMGKKHE